MLQYVFFHPQINPVFFFGRHISRVLKAQSRVPRVTRAKSALDFYFFRFSAMILQKHVFQKISGTFRYPSFRSSILFFGFLHSVFMTWLFYASRLTNFPGIHLWHPY